jgi:hypothetical protein
MVLWAGWTIGWWHCIGPRDQLQPPIVISCKAKQSRPMGAMKWSGIEKGNGRHFIPFGLLEEPVKPKLLDVFRGYQLDTANSASTRYLPNNLPESWSS